MHKEPFGYQVAHYGYLLTSCPGLILQKKIKINFLVLNLNKIKSVQIRKVYKLTKYISNPMFKSNMLKFIYLML